MTGVRDSWRDIPNIYLFVNLRLHQPLVPWALTKWMLIIFFFTGSCGYKPATC